MFSFDTSRTYKSTFVREGLEPRLRSVDSNFVDDGVEMFVAAAQYHINFSTRGTTYIRPNQLKIKKNLFDVAGGERKVVFTIKIPSHRGGVRQSP